MNVGCLHTLLCIPPEIGTKGNNGVRKRIYLFGRDLLVGEIRLLDVPFIAFTNARGTIALSYLLSKIYMINIFVCFSYTWCE